MSNCYHDGQFVKYLHGNSLEKFWEDYFAKEHDGESSYLYIDFPFCKSTCKYCMYQPSLYHKHLDQIPLYESELINLLKSMRHALELSELEGVVFGGGTASLMSKETIRTIIDNIPGYHNLLVRKMEVHPRDLTPEYTDFVINDMDITKFTVGIQSFDKDANAGQNREVAKLDDLVVTINEYQRHGITTNIDLVALFNGDTEHDWDIFKEDIKIIDKIVKPDSFYTCVNYNTGENYYQHTLRMRQIMAEYLLKENSVYAPSDPRMLLLTLEDVKQWLDLAYIFVTPEHGKYLNENGINKSRLSSSNYIGLGGNDSHPVFSYTCDGHNIFSHYNFFTKRFIHKMMATDESVPSEPSQQLPSFTAGRFLIPSPN